ncbi:MAG: hypothetical protein QGF46_06160 [Planctomycetota bacterium]|jgi:hypothetical protein|nr:hypothetical protein [Planctomycetota bacterium]
MACSQPEEFIQVGDTIIYADTIDSAAENLRFSFPEYGEATLRSNLLLHGLAEAEILHQSKPEASLNAYRKLNALYRAIDGKSPNSLLPKDLLGFTKEIKEAGPSPSQHGAGTAAAVAVLSPKQWAPPYKTSTGWSISYLHSRAAGQLSMASINVETISIAVGGPNDYVNNRLAWNELPLQGSDTLLSFLPFEFRNNRSNE